MIPLGSARKRRLLVTFTVAGVGALFAEHLLKPKLKKTLKVR